MSAVPGQKSNPNNWVDEYAEMLYGYCIIRVKDKMTAEDIVQETFLAALKGLSNFKGDSNEKTWLFSILKNKIGDHFRAKARLYNNSEMDSKEQDDYDLFFDNEYSIDHWKKLAYPQEWGEVGHSKVQGEELLDAIKKCIDNLPENLSGVFILKHLEEKRSDEICKVLNIRTSNYWVLMHRAKLRLRKCLELSWFKV